MTRSASAWLAFATALLLGGCPGSLENPERFDGMCDAEVLMARTCGTGTVCHDVDAPQGGLDLFSAGVASRVLDVAPRLCVMSNVYVDPTDPVGGSFILEKINPSPSCGILMPPAPDTPLTSQEVACITAWVQEISAGAGTDGGATDTGGDTAMDAAGDGSMP